MIKQTHAYLSLNQKDKKSFGQDGAYQYSYGRLSVFKMDDQDKFTGYIGGNSGGLSRDFTFEVTLEPGNYLICAEVEWASNATRSFAISGYAENFLDMSSMDRTEKLHRLVHKMPKWLIRESGERVLDIAQEVLHPGVTRYVMQTAGRVFFYYVNESEDMVIIEKLNFSRYENLRRVCYDQEGVKAFS